MLLGPPFQSVAQRLTLSPIIPNFYSAMGLRSRHQQENISLKLGVKYNRITNIFTAKNGSLVNIVLTEIVGRSMRTAHTSTTSTRAYQSGQTFL